METLLLVIQYICYVIAPLYTLQCILTVHGAITYEGSATQLGDALKGLRRTFKPGIPFFIALVAWCFLIAMMQN
jgi:microcystin degradation protein MlrC